MVVPVGTCYEDAWRYLIKEEEGELIHGTVESLGRRVGHAWVELPTGFIWEPESRQFIKKADFQAMAKPKEEARYCVTEAAIMLTRVGKHGPWTKEEKKQFLKRGNPEELVDVSQLKAFDLPNVRLAGSYATSRATPKSDIDILIGLTDTEWAKVTPRTPPAVLEKVYSILPEEKVSPMLYKLSDVKDMWFFKRGRMSISGAFVPINDAEMVQGLWNSSIGLKEIPPPSADNPIPEEVPAVPEVEVPVGWKAMMTPEEAGVWVSKSVIPDILYHGTSKEDAVGIRKLGFEVEEGKPIFLSRNRKTAEAFAGIAKEPEVLPVAINVGKVQRLDFNSSEVLSKVGSRHSVGSNEWVDDVLIWYNKEYARLVREGYDAVDVVVHLRTGAPIDHNQIILTNAKKITILTEAKPPAVKTEEWKLREAIADTVYGLAHGVKEGDIRKHLTRNPRAKYWFEPEDVDHILKKAKREVAGGNPMGKVITKEEAIGMLERLSMTPGEAARSLVADEAERREIMQTVQQRVKREQNKWAPMDPREGPPLPRIFAGLRWPWKKD